MNPSHGYTQQAIPNELSDIVHTQRRRSEIASTNLRNLKHSLIFVYPLINLLACILFHGDNMTIISLAFSLLLAALSFAGRKIDIGTIITIVVLLLTADFSLLRERTATDYSACLMFAITVAMFIAYSPRYFDMNEFREYANAHEKRFHLVQISFLGILAVYVARFGLRAGWGAYVLQGPYNYPHTLSYLLLLFAMMDMYYLLNKQSKISIVLLIVVEALIGLTAVRTALFASVAVFLFAIIRIKREGKINYLIFAFAIVLAVGYILLQNGLLDSIVAKTQLAMSNSTFTNGRGRIALSSLEALRASGDPLWNSLAGVGMSNLLNSNLLLLTEAIHAHNDFIDVLVCFGAVNLCIYLIAFVRFSRKCFIWVFLSLGLLAFANGLYPYADCIPMIVFARTLFESAPQMDDGFEKGLEL